MRHILDLANMGKQANTLIILLPGANHLPEDFIKQGFVRAVRQRQLDIDLVMPELSFDLIADQTVLEKMHDTVMQPYLAMGYSNIWIAGISIGGYVAIAYAQRHPGKVNGLLLLAPYPGNRITTGEITLAGGVKAWTPDDIADEDTERGNWNWLKNHANITPANLTPANLTEVHLAYGVDDRFADGIAMMTQVLADEYIDKMPGGHDWPVWEQLWRNFLDKRFSIKS